MSWKPRFVRQGLLPRQFRDSPLPREREARTVLLGVGRCAGLRACNKESLQIHAAFPWPHPQACLRLQHGAYDIWIATCGEIVAPPAGFGSQWVCSGGCQLLGFRVVGGKPKNTHTPWVDTYTLFCKIESVVKRHAHQEAWCVAYCAY